MTCTLIIYISRNFNNTYTIYGPYLIPLFQYSLCFSQDTVVLTFGDYHCQRNLNFYLLFVSKTNFIQMTKKWQNCFYNVQLPQEMYFCLFLSSSVLLKCRELLCCTHQFCGHSLNWVINGWIWQSQYESSTSVGAHIIYPIIKR